MLEYMEAEGVPPFEVLIKEETIVAQLGLLLTVELY
jgi:hypothetical protein